VRAGGGGFGECVDDDGGGGGGGFRRGGQSIDATAPPLTCCKPRTRFAEAANASSQPNN
jgi:hypothetical protein